ncbi:MAG: hypothetical protein WBL35_02160 [Ornithinibacter sp.]
MTVTQRLTARAQLAAYRLAERGRQRAERGDVPGWVLITLMTAGLVTALWVVAKDQLVSLFQSALSSVKA